MDNEKYLGVSEHDLLVTVAVIQGELQQDVRDINLHLKEQNGSIRDLISENAENSSWRVTSKWIIGIWSGVNVTLTGGIIFAAISLL